MPMVQQHRENNTVYVRTDSGTYMDTPENFAADYGTPIPQLPTGATERIYEPDKRHALVNGPDVVGAGPVPWPEGDAILGAYRTIMAAKKQRDDALIEEMRRNAAANVNN